LYQPARARLAAVAHLLAGGVGETAMNEGLKGLGRHLWRRRGMVFLGLLGVVGADVAQLFVPMVVKGAVDGLSQQVATPSSLTRAGLMLVGLAAASFVAKVWWRHFLMSASRLAEVEIRNAILEKALALSTRQHQETRIGEFLALATNDVDSIKQALAFGLLALFDSLFFSAMTVSAMLWLDWRLTLWAVLPLPVLGLVMGLALRRIYHLYDGVQASFEQLTEKVRESIQGMRVLRAAVAAEGDSRDFERLNQQYFTLNMDYVRTDATFRPLIMVFAGSSTAVLLLIGGARVVEGLTTVGTFAAFTTYLAQLTWPMIAAGWMFVLIQRGAVSMNRVENLLALPEETPLPVIEHDFRGQLEVRNLTFTYPKADQPTLYDVSFTLPAGHSLGIVGEVGAGKTTLLLLLNRFFEPPAGTIFLDGIDITTMNLAQLRAQFSWVSQEAFLFSDTIEANLRLAAPDAPFAELEAACRRAAVHQEILAFPKGYQTLLGERGISLSGGQRQRLCLARALLKDCPAFLLDDTLSAVDHQTEHQILESWRQGPPRTRLIISHRLSAVSELETVLVLTHGRVVDQGPHRELISRPGLYRDLYRLQNLEGAQHG
ncbi:MAG: ABC transporter ATP-binding protein, partial [Candidatus Eremiobacteraeota bacterium]|nr:ABC transporter ATP-binding protein [Candidatus Eremiobacteraeota bacterium]